MCKTLKQIWQRNQEFYREAKEKWIQYHWTSFVTNAKGSSLSGKENDKTGNEKIGKAHQ